MKKNSSNTKLKWIVPNLVDLAKMGQISSGGISLTDCPAGNSATTCRDGDGAVACAGGTGG